MKRRGVSFLEMLAMEMKVQAILPVHAHCHLFQTPRWLPCTYGLHMNVGKVTKLFIQVLCKLHVTKVILHVKQLASHLKLFSRRQ